MGLGCLNFVHPTESVKQESYPQPGEAMAEYETRQIKGWRGRLEDTAKEIRTRFWNAPSITTYFVGIEAPSNGRLSNSVRWFKRVFGPERAAASEELRQLRREKRRMRQAERTEGDLEKLREWHRQWRARQTAEWRQDQVVKKQLRCAAKPELYRAIELRTREKMRDIRNERRRLQRNANLAEFRVREQAKREANRQRINECARARCALKKSQQSRLK